VTAYAQKAPPKQANDAAVGGQQKDPKADPCARYDKDYLKKRECELAIRDRWGNGINVGSAKVYDDSLLQQMLQNAEAKLAAMQVLDQSGISAKLGSVTGATLQASSLGVNVQGPSVPQTQTTSNGATGSTTTTQAPTGTTVAQTSGLPAQNVVTTLQQTNPPAFTATAPSTSLPTSFSVSASDILNEEMQLTYEIANLRLLLEGSLSDRFDKTRRIVNPRVTLGFPIALTPDRRYKDAVAVVEVEVTRERGEHGDEAEIEPPVITALLPREKTYNIAAIKDRNTSIGGGIATQLVGVSGSFFRTRKSYYIVQDQDTLALTFDPDKNEKKEKVGFSWQFRPVLGEEYVRAGLKQTFVQLSFSKVPGTPNFGAVRVRTYWRRFDRKRGIVGEIISDSLTENTIPTNIPSFQLIPDPATDISFNETDTEDLGGGQMLVSLESRFLLGTSVRIGTTVLGPGSPGFSFDQERIRFVAPISDLATKNVALVGRDGSELPLIMKRDSCTNPLKIENVEISTVDQTNSLVKVTINDRCYLLDESSKKPGFDKGHKENIYPPLIMVVGNRVFGYSDALVSRNIQKTDLPECKTVKVDDQNAPPKCIEASLSAVVPTALLLNNPKITLKSLFQRKEFEASKSLANYFGGNDPTAEYLLSQTERLLLIDQQDGKGGVSTFLLFGNRLGNIQPVPADAATIVRFDKLDDQNTLVKVQIQTEKLKTMKFLVLRRGDERPFLVQLPAADAKNPPAELKPSERLVVGADEVTVTGEGLQELTRVTTSGDAPLPAPEKAKDGKSVKVRGLSGAGVTTTPGTKTIKFWFGDQARSVTIEVVNSKIETVAK
jgi:hypothetical protein